MIEKVKTWSIIKTKKQTNQPLKIRKKRVKVNE